MRLDRRHFLTGLVATAATPAAARAPDQPNLEHRKILDLLARAIDTRFYRQDRVKLIGFRQRIEAVRYVIEHSATLGEIAPLINGILKDLKTSHTQFVTPDDVEFHLIADTFRGSSSSGDEWLNPPPFPNIGLFTSVFDGRHHITDILDHRAAARADLAVGDEIVSIDGKPWQPIASLRDKEGQNVTIAVRRQANGPLRDVTLTVEHTLATNDFNMAMLFGAKVIQRSGKRIGYIRIWHMRQQHALSEAMARIDGGRLTYRDSSGREVQFRSSGPHPLPLDGLVIDVRGKLGGHPFVAQSFLADLIGPRGGEVTFSMPPPSRFKGRSALLIDANTRSAGELFAQGFANESVGPIFGGTTRGAVSAGGVARLPGPSLLYVAVARVTINGVDLEGVGVEPTHRVERLIPYSAGADPVLEAALSHLAGA